MKGIYILVVSIVAVSGVSAQIVFYEDFNDYVADGFSPLIGEWSIIDGTYFCHVEGVNQPGLSVFGSAEWADYRLDYSQLISEGCINHRLQFRMQSLDDHYVFGMSSDPYNDIWLRKVQDGDSVVLLHIANYFSQIGIWHHFTIIVESGYISAFVDGVHLFTYEDETDPILNGYIGLCAWSGGQEQWQDTYYDDIEVQINVIPNDHITWGGVKTLYR